MELGWGLLVAAIVGDAAGTIALERSEGMRRARPATVAVLAYLTAVMAFGAALEHVAISVADAVFAAGSTTLIASVGVALHRERLNVRKGLGLALVITGVAVLHLEGTS